MLLQYILTGLAGIMLGIAAMRVWQSGLATGGKQPPAQPVAEPAPEGERVAVEPGSSGEAAEIELASEPGTPDLLDRVRSIPPARLLLGGTAVIAVIAGLVMVLRPDGDALPPSGISMAPGQAEASAAQALDDVDTMIERLAKRLEANPDDGEGFRMLGWSYTMTGHPEKAIPPFKRALALLPGNALVHAGYAEAMTGVAGGKVSPQAKAEFEKAVALDPAEPRSRYFLALWKAQNGQEKQALEEWIVLANSGSPDAPWQADVRRQITEVSGKLGIDVASRLKQPSAGTAAIPGAVPAPDAAAMQAARALPPAQQQAMIDGMVEGLAQKLKSNPGDAAGWAKLLRSRMVLGQPEQAGRDLVIARKALAGDAAGLSAVNAAASAAGVPGG